MNGKHLIILFALSAAQLSAQPGFIGSYPDSLNKSKVNRFIISESATYLCGLYFLQNIWYKDHDRVPFHWYNDARGYLQIDKCGHAFSSYRYSYAAYYALRKAGVDKKKALLYGGPTGFMFQAPIEVFDGIYEGWGFSWFDIMANAFGSALFTVQEIFADQQLVLMKFSYSPSPYTNYHEALGETPLESFFYDYNAHTYWLSANLKGITHWEKVPPWLNLAFGYSANGMIKEFSNPTRYKGQPFHYFERYRQYIVSLDVDLSKFPVKNPVLKGVFRTVNLIKIPFPAIELSRINNIKPYGIYF